MLRKIWDVANVYIVIGAFWALLGLVLRNSDLGYMALIMLAFAALNAWYALRPRRGSGLHEYAEDIFSGREKVE